MTDEKAIVKLPEEAYAVLDRLDENMITSELAGLIEYGAQELIYSFEIAGRQVTGLSWPGAKALARWMADKGHPMDAVEKEITQDDETWYADVRVLDKSTGLALWGSSKCKKIKLLRSGEEKPDEFSRTIALNKAQRNAILAHVPDKQIAQFIKQAVDKGKVKKVDSEQVQEIREQSKRDLEERRSREGDPPQIEEPNGEPTQTELVHGIVTVKTVNYNLRAAGVDESLVGPAREEGDFIIVEASRELEDGDHYLIFGVLEPMGASVWQEVGHFGQWKIPKKEAEA